jgi:hypothetical protein
LIVLVPINWIVFRLLGRVELAWVAAPLIAIVGAFTIARAVQLDVGFSRSQSSISIVEVPSGYSRGYSASFASLYTSLTTNYSAFNADSSGIVIPMPTREEKMMTFTRDTPMTTYRYASDRGEGLESFPVRSNSTTLIRAEHPCEIGGQVQLKWLDNNSDAIQIDNQSSLKFSLAGIIAMDQAGQMRKGWVGDNEGGSVRSVPMELAVDSSPPKERSKNSRRVRALYLDGWGFVEQQVDEKESKEQESKMDGDTTIDVKPLIASLLTSHSWHPGEAMMIGVCDQAFSPTVIAPVASQSQDKSLFIIHLFRDSIGTASPDINIPKKSPSQAGSDDPSFDDALLEFNQ